MAELIVLYPILGEEINPIEYRSSCKGCQVTGRFFEPDFSQVERTGDPRTYRSNIRGIFYTCPKYVPGELCPVSEQTYKDLVRHGKTPLWKPSPCNIPKNEIFNTIILRDDS